MFEQKLLFVVLAFAAASRTLCINAAVPQRIDDETWAELVESTYGPCLRRNVDCAQTNGRPFYEDYRPGLIYWKTSNSPPAECDCDLDSQRCVRECFFVYYFQDMEASMAMAPNNEDAIRQVPVLREQMRPCILEDRDFGGASMYDTMDEWVRNKINASRNLPDECRCNIREDDSCYRMCLLVFMKSRSSILS